MTPSPNKSNRLWSVAIILCLGIIAGIFAINWRAKKLAAREGTRSTLYYDTVVGTVRVTGPSITGNNPAQANSPQAPGENPGAMPLGNTASISMKKSIQLPVATIPISIPDPLVEYRLPVGDYGKMRTRVIEDLGKKSIPLVIKETEKQSNTKELLDLGYRVDVRKVKDAIGLKVRLEVSRKVYSHPDSVEGVQVVVGTYEAQSDYAWVAPKDIEATMDTLLKEVSKTFDSDLKRANAPEPPSKEDN